MASSFDQVTIGAVDREADVIRVELWRTVSSVGLWMALLRNIGGVYNGVFDVQNAFRVDVNGANTLMEGRLDGPDCVTLRGRDLESDWDEYAITGGVDQAQDLLFHNDFEYFYPDVTQTLYDVWDDVINTQLFGLTNITFLKPVPDLSPVVGAMEFREGTSFLASTQELFRRAGYLFYVDDSLAFQSGAPGWSAAGGVLRSVAEALNNNILDIVDLTERDGDKHYNYIRLYGKNPMFDAYSEFSSGLWSNAGIATVITDDATSLVGSYSVRGNNVALSPILELDFTGNAAATNYAEVDLSKGELGAWIHYSGGTALARRPIRVTLRETAAAGGNSMNYFGTSTQCYLGRWGWITAPIGENVNIGAGAPNEWWPVPAADFSWDQIENIRFRYEAAAAPDKPTDIRVDGLSLPIPPIAVAQNVGQQGIYRRRPYVDYWQHIRTQTALDAKATQLLTQHESTAIDKLKLVTEGNIALRYAGQSTTVNIPSLGLNNSLMYMTQIHHIIEPYSDVSGGFAFDFISEVELVPINGVGYDMSRLRVGSVYSPTQLGSRVGTGVRVK